MLSKHFRRKQPNLNITWKLSRCLPRWIKPITFCIGTEVVKSNYQDNIDFFTTIFLTSLFHFQKISSGLNPQEVNSAKNNEINKLLYTDEDSQVLKCISLLVLFLSSVTYFLSYLIFWKLISITHIIYRKGYFCSKIKIAKVHTY